MRPADLGKTHPGRSATPAHDVERRGASALVDHYRRLALTRSHLLARILQDVPPTQWEHYPCDDAISHDRRFQWYYHSHSPADRPESKEHGHFHLFARTECAGGHIASRSEQTFLDGLAAADSEATTRHLLCIGLSPLGVPISLFTVNRWVTGDLLLSSASSLGLLESMELNTGYPVIDAVLMALTQLYRPDIRVLMRRRDAVLRARAAEGPRTLDDIRVEVLSELSIDIDQRIATLLADDP